MNKRRSWKTTTFALTAAIGAAVVAGTRTGLIDGSKLPDWVNIGAGLCSVIGPGGLGVFARDDDVTSEETGATAKKCEHETEFVAKQQKAQDKK